MNAVGGLQKALEEIIIEHCPMAVRSQVVITVHAMAIKQNFKRHEEVTKRFSQAERLSELHKSLYEAVKKMGAMSNECSDLIGRKINLAATEHIGTADDEQLQRVAEVKIEQLNEKGESSKNGTVQFQRTMLGSSSPLEMNRSSRSAFEEALGDLRELHEAVGQAQEHYTAKYPKVRRLHTRQVAVAAACNRIWLYEHENRPGRDFQSDAPGPFGTFQIAVFEALGFERKQARTAQRTLIDLGGIDAVGFSIVPVENRD